MCGLRELTFLFSSLFNSKERREIFIFTHIASAVRLNKGKAQSTNEATFAKFCKWEDVGGGEEGEECFSV